MTTLTVESAETCICSDCITSDPRFGAIFEKHFKPMLDQELEDEAVYEAGRHYRKRDLTDVPCGI